MKRHKLKEFCKYIRLSLKQEFNLQKLAINFFKGVGRQMKHNLITMVGVT